MHDFRVEHQPVIFSLLVLNDGERRVGGRARDRKARRHFGDAVAMAHPDRMLFADAPGGVEQLARRFHLDIGAAEFAVMAALDLAAELGGHRHLAVADAEHGNAGIEDRLRRARRTCFMHRFRATGEDHGFRLHLAEGGFGLLERDDFGINALLADAAGDQLRDLAAEIDNQKSCHAPRPRRAPTLRAGLAAVMDQAITRPKAVSQDLKNGLSPSDLSLPPRSGGEGLRVGGAATGDAVADSPAPPTPPRHALTRAEGGEKAIAEGPVTLRLASSAPTRKTRRCRCGAGSSKALRRIAAWQRRKPRPCPRARSRSRQEAPRRNPDWRARNCADLAAVFRRQHRAGDISDAAARLDQSWPRDQALRPGPSGAVRARRA